MPRVLNRLTARQVITLQEPGRHSDGGGLYLRLTKVGAKGWTFLGTHDGKRFEASLGTVAGVSLADAREQARRMREAGQRGLDPRIVLKPAIEASKPQVPTFGTFAEAYIASVEDGWKNPIHRKQWRQSLRDHAGVLNDKLVTDITTDDLLAVLAPIWLDKSETASRVRGRIERILDAAKAKGIRSKDSTNPAAFRGHLALLLPRQSKLTRGHHAALPWKEAPAFMMELRSRKAVAARCLEFVILTAARSGEALGATWDEIDLEKRLWTVPATRMKAGAEHVVPLSSAATALLEALAPAEFKPGVLIFAVGGAARSNMAMAMLLRRMARGDLTTHGFRSTFRDWAGDGTDYPRELIEQALAHTITNKAERSYRRGTAIERRRELMEAWARYLQG